MSEAPRAVKRETVKGETIGESVEVAEAIKALQTQLADLRKIVQAAKSSGNIDIESVRRQ